jgi:hypothetical protein
MSNLRPIVQRQRLKAGLELSGVTPEAGPNIEGVFYTWDNRDEGGLFTFNSSLFHIVSRIKYNLTDASSWRVSIVNTWGEVERVLYSSANGDDEVGFHDLRQLLLPGEKIAVYTDTTTNPSKQHLVEVVAFPVTTFALESGAI